MPAEEPLPAAVCEVCGIAGALRANDQSCLVCLLLGGLEDAASVEVTGPRLQDPSLLYQHYRLSTDKDGRPHLLGQGAMGVTYRAEDVNLGVPVALKVIQPRLSARADVRARFRHEARVAARLRHPHVASVFHFGTVATLPQGEACFYAMELVEGETLEARVRCAGPLPVVLVLEIARQVAGALVEAEALGLVHRDLKPANLMLVARRGDQADDPPHVKVIDFGLAQAIDLAAVPQDGDGGALAPTVFAGTPSFASPEQFARGGVQGVDTRSDIYSLGVTLWYLLCGQLPFSGSTLTGLYAQQGQASLPLEQLRAARVPAPVVALLQRMLQPRPQDRPASSRALVEELTRCQQRLARSRRAPMRRAVFLVVGLALLGGLAALLAASRGPSKAPTRSPSRPAVSQSLAVLPFANLNPGEQPGYFPVGVQQQLSTGLARLASLQVVTPGDGNQDPPARTEDEAALGQDLNVDHLIEGEVQWAADKVSIEVRLVDVRSPGAPWHRRYERPAAELFAVETQIVRDLAVRLGVDVALEEEAAIAKPPTTSAEAYDLYLQAHAAPSFFPGTAEMRAHLRQSVAALEKALALDPNFLLAHCELATKHDEFGIAADGATPEELSVDHRLLAEVALQNARRLDPEAGEVHLAYAAHFFLGSRDHRQAQIEAELAARKLPNDPQIHQMLGVIARNQGRWEDSAWELRRAVDLGPRDPANLFLLIQTYQPLRRYADLERVFSRYAALLPADARLDEELRRQAARFEESGELEPLRVALAAARPVSENEVEAHNLYGIVHALLARDADALSQQVAARKQPDVTRFGWTYPKAWFIALAARLRGDTAGARTAFEAARVEAAQNVLANPTAPRPLSVLALIDAGLGRTEEATQEAKRACEMVPPSRSAVAAPEMAGNLAVVYAWSGQTDAAFALLEDLAGGPAGRNLWYRPTYGDLKCSPLWDPLRGDPRFAALLQRLAPWPPGPGE